MKTSAPALIFFTPTEISKAHFQTKNWNDTEIIFYFGTPVF